MSFIKDCFGFTLALIAILFSIQFSILSNNVVKEYEKLMNNDYNIIVVSTKELNKPLLQPIVPTLESVILISSKNITDRLNNDISSKNLSILQNTLPKFYSIKLNSLPSPKYMQEIRAKLLKFDGINKVETFTHTHNKVYKTLKLMKFISYVFMCLVAFIGLLLMSKQIRVWIFEHKERVEIMALFGAGFWQKSAVIYRNGFLASIFSTIIVTAFFYFLPTFEFIKDINRQLSISVPSISLIDEAGVLFGISLIISAFMVSLVMKRVKQA